MQHAHNFNCLAYHDPQRLMKPLTTIPVNMFHLLMSGIALALDQNLGQYDCIQSDFVDHAPC